MSVYHDEVEIEDFEYDEDEEVYYYPCPCGDQFQISKAELAAGVEEATCPSCSLVIKVIYDKEAFAAKQEEFVRDEEKQLMIQKIITEEEKNLSRQSTEDNWTLLKKRYRHHQSDNFHP